MGRDKAKDDDLFNCSQQHEEDYVVGLYSDDEQEKVREIIRQACEDNVFNNSTHEFVYDHINKELAK